MSIVVFVGELEGESSRFVVICYGIGLIGYNIVNGDSTVVICG